jgi:hypothetical protein
MPVKNYHLYILENRHKGFDELAHDLEISKDKIKEMWNDMNLGWHMTPRTFVELRYLGEGQYLVLKDIVVFIAPLTPMIIPKGLITDFASIPRFARWFISPDATWITVAALLHDVLYAGEWVDRQVADSIFKQIMRYRKASFIKRNIVYFAVRLGGGFVWRKHDKIEVEQYRILLQEKVSEYMRNKDVINNSKKI